MKEVINEPTKQQFITAENLSAFLETLPDYKKTVITVMINAFVSGMDTQASLKEDSE